MLTPIVATADPYDAADEFIANGWTLVFATPRNSSDRLTCVRLHDAEVMLGVDGPEFLPSEARQYRGAGVQFYIEVPADEIEAIHVKHQDPGLLAHRDWGVRSFVVELQGYKFMIAAAA